MVFEITLVLFLFTLFAFVVIDDTLNHRDCSSKANTREAADTDVYKNCANHDCFHSLSPSLVKEIIIVISCKVRFSRSLTTKRLAITNLLQIVKATGDALITRAVESIEADAGTTVGDIKEYALQQAISGKEWPGWKLVEGRSNRRYTSEDAVSKAVKAAGFDPYEKKLLGITAMQKLLGKSRFEELLAAYIEKPQGKPTLVPESDKRPAMNTAKNDFMEEYDNE